MQPNLKLAVFLLWLLMLLAIPACKKDKADPVTPEEDLVISTDAAALALVPAPTYNFNLSIDSKMPALGVHIVVDVKGEVDNQVVPQTAGIIETANKKVPLIIQGLPRQKICFCTIKVTSRNKSTNTAFTTFRVVYK